MSPIVLTAYVLIWPILVAGVLFVLVRSFAREWRQARKEGRTLV